jgi:hypothetical protein
MGKIAAAFELLKVGRAVANPAAWKAGQITATALGAAILAAVKLAEAYGYKLPVDAGTANDIAWLVIVLANLVLTITTSKSVGVGRAALPSERAPDVAPEPTKRPAEFPGGGTDSPG